MREIIHNNDNLKDNDINNYVNRAKLIVENSKGELLLVYSHHNYFLIGGHVDEGETFDDCIIREIKEEAGIIIPFKKRDPFISIKYFFKDYPIVGKNTRYINNYYSLKYDLVPDLKNIELTDEEKEGNFLLTYITKEKVISTLNESLKTCTKENAVKDTIRVITEYLELKDIIYTDINE